MSAFISRIPRVEDSPASFREPVAATSSRIGLTAALVLILWAFPPQVSLVRADFSQSDMTGTWRLHSKSVPNVPGQTGGCAVGSITFADDGTPSGTFKTNTPGGDCDDGSTITITGGSFTMTTGGVFTGTQTLSTGGTVAVTGTMAASKDQTWATATVRDAGGNPIGFNLASLVKQNGISFGPADMEGIWRSYRLVTQTDGSSVWVTGRQTFDASGNLMSGTLTLSNNPDTPIPLTSGSFVLGSNGILTTATDANTGTTRSYQGTMAQDKKRIVTVFTTFSGATPIGYGIAIFVKETTTTFSTPDFQATWHFHALFSPRDAPPTDGNWVSGTFPINGGGEMTSGSVILGNGDSAPIHTVPGEALVVNSNGTFDGTLGFPAEGGGTGSIGIPPQGGMLVPMKDQAFGVFTVTEPGSTDPDVAVFAMVKEASSKPTLAVAKVGAGSGTVGSDQGGFSCGSDCAESYPIDTVATLTATPTGTFSFAGFANCDNSETGNPCSVTLHESRFVAVAFGPPTPPILGSLSPVAGLFAGGQAVSITGKGFVADQTTVTFGGVAAQVTVNNSTHLIATTPAHAPTPDGSHVYVDIVITTPAGTAFGIGEYAYGSGTSTHPLITAVPETIFSGGQATILGNGFTPGSVVKLFVPNTAGKPPDVLPPPGFLTPVGQTPTSLTFNVPPTLYLGEGYVAVSVVNTDQGFPISNDGGAVWLGTGSQPTLTTVHGAPIEAASRLRGIHRAFAEAVVPLGIPVTVEGSGYVAGPPQSALTIFSAVGGTAVFPPSDQITSTTLTATVLGSPTVSQGPGSLLVSNPPSYADQAATTSNGLTVALGARIRITGVNVVGNQVTVTGQGFAGGASGTVINLFNAQPGGAVNLGGLDPNTGNPKIPLNVNANGTSFTFTLPGGAMSGPAFVQALNAPFIPFTTAADAAGAFTIP